MNLATTWRTAVALVLVGFVCRCQVDAQNVDFVRGDANADAAIDLSDPVGTLFALFGQSSPLACMDAADSDDSGAIERRTR